MYIHTHTYIHRNSITHFLKIIHSYVIFSPHNNSLRDIQSMMDTVLLIDVALLQMQIFLRPSKNNGQIMKH